MQPSEHLESLHWYAIHTKPLQEKRALLNLEQQGYECYLPLLTVEKLRRNKISHVDEPLFARYLFIRLDNSQTGKSWAPIRSTLGVSRLVSFSTEPARIDDLLIEALKTQQSSLDNTPQSLYTKGDRLMITDGPFIGLEAIYQMHDGESRAMVLINLLSKTVRLKIPPANLKKIE